MYEEEGVIRVEVSVGCCDALSIFVAGRSGFLLTDIVREGVCLMTKRMPQNYLFHFFLLIKKRYPHPNTLFRN